MSTAIKPTRISRLQDLINHPATPEHERTLAMEKLAEIVDKTGGPIVIPMTTSPEHQLYTHGEDRYGHEFQSAAGVVLNGRFRHQGHDCDYTITYFDDTTSSRRETGGPIITGEWAFMSALPTIISANPRPWNTQQRIHVKDGDLVSILGRTFRIQDDRRLYNPRLVRV